MSLGEVAWSHLSTPLRHLSSAEREEESSCDHRSLQQRCLRALAAVSTHSSIVRETVPVLLQHLRKVQKGNTACGRQLHGVRLGGSCLPYRSWLGGSGGGTRSPGVGWDDAGEGGVGRAALPRDPSTGQAGSWGGCCGCLMRR